MKRPLETAPGERHVRIQKFLSDAGVASRRHAEELIEQGRVLLNDEVVEKLPAFVDPEHDVIIVDGARVRVRPLAYFMVNKPRGVVCTNFDPDGRPRAVDLLPPDMRHLFVVGRLDEFSTGLLLLTNDGELATRVTHPRYGIVKLYRAEVAGEVPNDLPGRLRKGVFLSDGKVQAGQVDILKRSRQQSTIEMTMLEGRSSGVRRAMAKLGHKVLTLKRVKIGSVALKDLPLGACREMSPHEVNALWKAVKEAEAKAPPASRGRKRRNRGASTGQRAGRPQTANSGSRDAARPARPGETRSAARPAARPMRPIAERRTGRRIVE